MKICTLNKIAACGTERFGAGYTVGEDMEGAAGVMVRSAAMHDMELPESLWAIARAGAGAAVALLLMIPPILIFVISQSSIMETMSQSGLK